MALAKLQQPLITNWRLVQVLANSGNPTCAILQVRFRKPRWLVPQRAPSKEGIYYHKPKPTAHDEAKTELAYKSYNAILRSIVATFQEEILLKQEKGAKRKVTFDEEAHHVKCMAYNDAYNAEMREERGKQLDKIMERQQLELKQKEDALQKDLQTKLRKYDEEVLTALEENENWVTLENVEEKINEAMDNIVNYNFSVNIDGTIARRSLIP